MPSFFFFLKAIIMPILFQTISERSQKHFQTSIIPSLAKSILFARKIQLNWNFAPAISHVTTHSFITPTLLQPCTTHTLEHPWPKDGQLVPYPPAALPSPATPFHLQSPTSSQHTHLQLPHFTIQQQGRKERRKQQRREEGKEPGGWSVVGTDFSYTQKGYRIENSRGKTTKAWWRSSTVEICDEPLMTQGFHSTCIPSFGAH